MSTRIIVLFSLKPGTSAAEYEAWARSRDLPTVRGLQSIAAFDVFKATGLLTGGTPPYDYIEIIDIADMALFGTEVASEAMQKVAAEFTAIADATFILTEPL